MNVTTALRKTVRIARAEGFDGLFERALRKAATRTGGMGEPFLLRAEDVVDSADVVAPPPARLRAPGEPLEVGWIMAAPGPGSGGHTTVFRFVEALEAAGHICVLFLHETRPDELAERTAVIRQWWPSVRAEVRTVADGLPDMDAWVATAWQTAHVLARRSHVRGRRFYLAQDFEPYFYGRGAAYELAEDSYRFGFQMITVGQMVADELQARFGIESIVAEFGCDQDVYRVTDDGPRNEVVFYARPGVPRRGFELGLFALQEFARRRPDVVINTFGVPAGSLGFPARVHGKVTPARLNELYNRCAAGLALSFTNISLTPYELLAAGVLPVVNDWTGSRAVLDNPYVEWARATPTALADALERAVDRRREISAESVTQSVRNVTWGSALRTVVNAIETVGTAVPAVNGKGAGA
jgi:O-antigen biosynthesis protein